MKTAHIKQAFNKAALQYDNACQLQSATGEKLIAMLKKHCTNHHRIVDAGCGTGIVTKELAAACIFKEFYAIDIADRLLDIAKEKLSPLGINIRLSDFDKLNHFNILFDIIFANLSLHWSTNLKQTLNSLRETLQKNGMLIFSIPLAGTFHEIEEYCSINNFLNYESAKNFILERGFNITAAEHNEIIFEFNNLSSALYSIKSVGAHYVIDENRKKNNFTKLRKAIKSENNKSINLTYHIGYFIAKK